MKRFAPILLVLSGWILAQFAGTPEQVYAQSRTSLASLQAAIDNILNGTTTVPNATNATTVGGIGAEAIATKASVETGLSSRLSLSGGSLNGSIAVDGTITATGPIQVGFGATSNTFNQGAIRYNAGFLEVSTSTGWRRLAYSN